MVRYFKSCVSYDPYDDAIALPNDVPMAHRISVCSIHELRSHGGRACSEKW